MNQCHFMGRLTADPELKNLANDKKVVNFRIAVDRRYKRGKETAKETAFLECEAWDSGAELIAKHFEKGKPIIIHASVKQEEWEDKTTSQKRSKLKFRVNSFEFVVPESKGAAKKSDEKSSDDAGEGDDKGGEGDIPF